MTYKNISALLLLCVFLTACGTKFSTPPRIEDRPVVVEQPKPAEPARPTIEPTATVPPPQPVQSLPAAVALRDQAANAAAANDHRRAIGLLERALRVSPNDPQTFYDLASSHLAMKQPQQALQLARRGLTLNPTNAQREALQRLATQSEAML